MTKQEQDQLIAAMTPQERLAACCVTNSRILQLLCRNNNLQQVYDVVKKYPELAEMRVNYGLPNHPGWLNDWIVTHLAYWVCVDGQLIGQLD